MIALNWFRSAAACLREYPDAAELFVVSHGQIELSDWVAAAHGEITEAEGRVEGIAIWTFALSRRADLYAGFLGLPVGEIYRIVMSSSQQELRGHMIQKWLACNARLELRVAKTHAKIARVWNGERKVLVHGSGNAAGGARTIEQWQVSRDPHPGVWELLEELEAGLPAVGCEHRVAVAASGLGQSEAKRQFAARVGLRPLKVKK